MMRVATIPDRTSVATAWVARALIGGALIGGALIAGAASAQDRPEHLAPPILIPSTRFDSAVPTPDNAVLRIPQPEARCDGAAVAPLYQEVLPAYVPGRDWRGAETFDLTFSIAADGRTLDIRPADGPPTVFDQYQATLAAWRFPAQPRKDCRLTIRFRHIPLAQAETADLLNYFAVHRETGALRDAVAKRLGGPGADCGERFGGRRPDVVSFPDFEKGRRPPPGGRSWSVTRWNIDAEGRTTDIHTLGSSGDADLDAEARRAVAETRMRPGPARTGCVYNVYRSGETLPAPPLPPEEQREDPLQQCPDAVGDRFRARSNPEFPRVFRDRSIEGWALVRFDIAPWGQIGNAAVVEAQPAAAFGADALRLVQRSEASSGFDAGVRCVVPVRYVLRDEAASETEQN